MAEAISSAKVQTQARVRFARVVAAAAFVFSLTSLAYGHLALVAAAVVCAISGLIAATVERDAYAGVGSLVAAAIAIASPAGLLTIATVGADHAAAQQAAQNQAAGEISEVDAADTHMRAYQPDIASFDLHAAGYARVTEMMKRDRERLQLARSLNSPDQSAIYSQLAALVSQAEQEHNQVETTKATMDQKNAADPARWAHIQSLCSLPVVSAADACARVRADYPPYRARVAQAFVAVARDDSAYAAQQPQQRAILDGAL